MKKTTILILTLMMIILSISTFADTKPDNTGILYVYAVLFPFLASYVSALAIQSDNSPRAMPSLMAGILWFISAQTTANIRFIDVVSDATYLDLGNPEFSIVFSLFGLIMVLFSVYLLFKPAEQAIREVQK